VNGDFFVTLKIASWFVCSSSAMASTVLITGASQGIGRAIAGLTKSLMAELAHEGIHVCGIYPNLIKASFLERATFRGNRPEDAQQRREQVEVVMKVPLVETPDTLAQVVWDAVEHQRGEVFVGSVKLSAGSYQLFSKGLR
jgi:short-subunit dehydrogenase